MTAAGEARESLSVLGAGWKEARRSSALLCSPLLSPPLLSSPLHPLSALQPVTKEEPKTERHDVKPSRRTSTSAARNRAERSNREPRFFALPAAAFFWFRFLVVVFFFFFFRRASPRGAVQRREERAATNRCCWMIRYTGQGPPGNSFSLTESCESGSRLDFLPVSLFHRVCCCRSRFCRRSETMCTWSEQLGRIDKCVSVQRACSG